MYPAIIRLCYRQLIDHRASSAFEQDVFNDSYAEWQLQAQRYNQDKQFSRLEEIIAHDPKASSLHYKVGFAVGLYIQQLNRQIPGLRDTTGKIPIPFSQHLFELVDSDLRDRRRHVVAISYTSEPLLFFGSVGNNLILSNDNRPAFVREGRASTFLLHLYEGLIISEYCPAPYLDAHGQAVVYHEPPATI